MASFVEQATLKVNDQSTKQIKAINRALKDLMRTARSARRIPIGLNLGRTQSQITSLKRQLSSLSSKRTQVNISTAAASRNLRSLNAQLRALQNRTVNVNIGTRGNRLPPPGGGGGRAIPAARQRVYLEFGSFRHFVQGELYGIMRAAIIDGLTAVRDQEVAGSRLAYQKLSPEEQMRARSAGRAISTEFPSLTAGQATGLLAESLPIVGRDIERAATLTRELAAMIEQQVTLGKSVQEATDSAINFGKAAEQLGRIYNREGEFDPAGLANIFDLFRASSAQIGKEFSGEFARQAVKYLRGSKLAVNDRGVALAFLLNEEMGTSGSVGYNQAITQLSGTRIQKKQLARLAALGLITTEQVAAGASSDGVSFTELVGAGAVDETQLRENILAWVRDRLIPAAQKAGVDTTDPTQVSKFASAITSDRTAIENVATLIARFHDLNRAVDQIEANRMTAEQARGVANDSLITSLQEARSQFSNVIESLVSSFKDTLIPAADATATALNALASFITGPDGEGSAGRAAGVAAGAGVAAIGAAAVGRSILQSLFNPLNQSAVALNGSAAALTQAAVALRGSAAIGAAGAGAGAGAVAGTGFMTLLSRTLGWAGLYGLMVGAVENSEVGQAIRAGDYVGSLAGQRTKGGRVGTGEFSAQMPIPERFGDSAVFALESALESGSLKMDQSATLFDQAFDSGATRLGQAGTDLGLAIGNGGTMASEAMLNAIIAGGQQAAAAMGAAINNAQVRVAPAVAPNTGAMTPTE